MGPGRFGPTFLAHDGSTDESVTVRVFAEPLSVEQGAALVQAFEAVCDTPLDHPSIARPVDAGATPAGAWVAHAWCPGERADQWAAHEGGRALHEIVRLLTPVAAAIDCAAAVGVHHGAMGLADIVMGDDRAVLSGFGAAQARAVATGAAQPTRGDDIRALAAIAGALLRAVPAAGGASATLPDAEGADPVRLQEAFDAVLAPDVVRAPASALTFIAALQDAQVVAGKAGASMHLEPDPLNQDPPAGGDPGLPAATSPSWTRHSDSAPDEGDTPPGLLAAHVPVRPGAGSRLFAALTPGAGPLDRGWSWTAVGVGLVAGLVCGAGGMYLLDHGGAEVRPRNPVVADRAVQAAQIDPRSSRAAAPAGTGWPDAQAAAAPVRAAADPLPAVLPAVPAPAGAGARRVARVATRRGPAPSPTRAGVVRQIASSASHVTIGRLQVLSRPAGAEVFLDGRSVGHTPLALDSVSPGDHRVRLHLPGYRPWVATTDVERGARARVAASLEQ